MASTCSSGRLTATFSVLPPVGTAVRRGGNGPEVRWRRDLNPRSVLADSRFQGECIRPLCHATFVQLRGGFHRFPAAAGAMFATFVPHHPPRRHRNHPPKRVKVYIHGTPPETRPQAEHPGGNPPRITNQCHRPRRFPHPVATAVQDSRGGRHVVAGNHRRDRRRGPGGFSGGPLPGLRVWPGCSSQPQRPRQGAFSGL
jgi:hypothetical protein